MYVMSFFSNLRKMNFRVPDEKMLNIKNFKKVVYLAVLLVMFVYTFRGSTIYSSIVYLSSNLENFSIIPDEVDIVKNVYPVFNENNYSFDETYIAEVVEEIKEEIEEPVTIDMVSYGTIDSIDKYSARDYINNLKELSVNISQGPGYENVVIGGNVCIRDYSDLPNIPYSDIIARTITLTKKNDNVYVYDTHASESYSNSELFSFDYTSAYRTTDSNYNMISVASKFITFLSEKNIEVVQDNFGHDYGSYTMSYSSSRKAIMTNIEKYGKFGVSIDMHRDAIADLSFAPKAVIGGEEVAQCMIVLGVGYDGARNDFYDENMALAIKLMALGEKVYPGLFRPMTVRNSTYNQDLNDMSLLIEVGATGNTLEEAYRAVRCLSNLFDIMYLD